MVEHSRYKVSDKQAGVKDGVLRNKLGVSNKVRLDNLESLLLDDTYQYFFGLLQEDKLKFELELLFEIHKYFLSTLYSWAGKLRAVNISKGDVFFAPAKHISRLMEEFGNVLDEHLPSSENSKKELSKRLAFIHAELNAIHPFREGNGRTIRLFLDLLAANSGYKTINYSTSSKEEYFEACKAGMKQDYEKMQKVIYQGLM